MRIAMIGSGYVGLVSGACFAKFGIDVTCVDRDEDKIERLQKGEIPIYEPGLADLVAAGFASGSLKFTTNLSAAVATADAVFIAVGTPSRRGDGHADLSYVYAASAEIAEALQGYTVVVTKSTVPVGTGSEVEKIVRDTRSDADFDVVSNPEFLREGSAIEDFMRPDRVVIGTESSSAMDVMRALYRPLFLNETPILFTERRTAELIKYATNAFLATKLSFVNAIAAVCEGVGADVNDVILGLGYDSRIGSEFLRPGPGWGGSCFPKDTKALVRIAAQVGYDFRLLGGVIAVNQEQFVRVVDKVRRSVGGDLSGRTVAVWALTFKAGTDDLRDSPALEIIGRLLEQGALVQAFDPTVTSADGLPSGTSVALSTTDACAGADVLVVLTEWDEFRWQDPVALAEGMNGRAVVDARNILDRARWQRHGFDYQGIGR